MTPNVTTPTVTTPWAPTPDATDPLATSLESPRRLPPPMSGFASEIERLHGEIEGQEKEKQQLKELWFEEHVKKWLREEATDEAPAEEEEIVEV